VRKLIAAANDKALAAADVRSWLAADLACGAITWFGPYAGVHRSNLAAVRARAQQA
jgi:hypothetical protein